jgi:hypothetical protein
VLGTSQRRGKRWFRNICLLCIESALKKKSVPKDVWKMGLCNTGHATNAKKHLVRKHKKHPAAFSLKAVNTLEQRRKSSEPVRSWRVTLVQR